MEIKQNSPAMVAVRLVYLTGNFDSVKLCIKHIMQYGVSIPGEKHNPRFLAEDTIRGYLVGIVKEKAALDKQTEGGGG